jgi:hypothetical protein
MVLVQDAVHFMLGDVNVTGFMTKCENSFVTLSMASIKTNN